MNHIKSFGSFINEEATNYLKLSSSVGLVKFKNSLDIGLTLYDFKENKVIGTISYNERISSEYGDVSMVASEKGLGSLMYEMAMIDISPKGLKPSGLINDEALSIWDKFIKRGDITKVQLEKTDPIFKQFDSVNKERIINTMFYMKPTFKYTSLIRRGEKLLADYNIDIQIIRAESNKYFKTKYTG